MNTRPNKYTPEEILIQLSNNLKYFRPAHLTDEILNSLPEIWRKHHSDIELYSGYRGEFPDGNYFDNIKNLGDDIIFPCNKFHGNEFGNHFFVFYPKYLADLIYKVFVEK